MILSLIIALYIATICLYIFFVGEEPGNSLLHNIFYLTFAILPVFGGVVATKVFGLKNKHGLALLFLTLGTSLLFLGEVTWFYFEFIISADPFPSVADVMYLLAQPFLFLGLFVELKIAGLKNMKMSNLVSALTVIVSLFFIGIVSYFGMYLAFDAEVAWIENMVVMAYGVADLILIITSIFILNVVSDYRGGKMFKGWLAIMFGFIAFLFADVLFAAFGEEYENFELLYRQIDLLWITAYGLFAIGFFTISGVIEDVKKRILKEHLVEK